MKRREIQKYLRMLGQELQKRQVIGEILVADEVMVLLDIGKPEVSNIDTYLAGYVEIPKSLNAYFSGHGAAIREAAASIAKREGLSANWLGKALKELFYTQSWVKWVEYPGLRIYHSPSDYAVVMKIATAGSYQDTKDIKTLAKKFRISKAQDMLALISKYVPEQLLVPELRLAIEQSLRRM
jgi:hypothetical protein